jgi:hypothetical protein
LAGFEVARSLCAHPGHDRGADGGGEKPSAAPAAKATKIAIFVLSVAVIVMWARLMHEDQRA